MGTINAGCSLLEALLRYNVSTEPDAVSAANFMKRCVAMHPSDRPSASELLLDDWLKDV
jgi:serine/threonine protein kinase